MLLLVPPLSLTETLILPSPSLSWLDLITRYVV
jgi:hypothetical protein